MHGATIIITTKFNTALYKDQLLPVITNSMTHNYVRDAKKFTKSLHSFLLNLNFRFPHQNTTSFFPDLSQTSLEHKIQPPI